jgi:hypothetical protein
LTFFREFRFLHRRSGSRSSRDRSIQSYAQRKNRHFLAIHGRGLPQKPTGMEIASRFKELVSIRAVEFPRLHKTLLKHEGKKF